MIVLIIIGIVLLCLIALILGISLIPIDIILQSEGFIPTVTVSVLGIKKEVYNKDAPKPEKDDEDEDDDREKDKKPMPKLLKKILGIENFDSKSALSKSVKEKGVGETLGEFFAVIKNYIENIKQILKSISVRYFRFNMVCAEEDSAKAALLYGTACAVVYPLAAYFSAYMKHPDKQLLLDISCDYELKSPTTNYELVLRFRIFWVLLAVLRIAKNNVMH